MSALAIACVIVCGAGSARALGCAEPFSVCEEAEVADWQSAAVQNPSSILFVKTAAGDMKEGDVILTVGTRSLTNRFDLERSLWGHKAGDIVEATVLRAGKKTTVSITLTSAETRTASTR